MDPTSLPVPPTRLIGRDADVAEVARAVSDQGTRLVTVIGPAGVGKTRLAIEIAHRHPPPDTRVVFVPLADLDDPGRFPAALLASLGGADVGSRPAVEVAVDLLADRNTFVVLDNFEHLVAAAPDVGRLIEGAPGLRVLTTSRRPLGLRAEQCVALQPLAVPADPELDPEKALAFGAVALFVARLEAADARYRLSGVDLPAITRICRGVNGLPLALELAAARARSLPLGSMADAIEARTDVFGPAASDLPARHRTISAAVQWSVDLLSPRASALWRGLSVYAGAPIDAVIAVAADIGPDPLDLLDELVAHSLLIREAAGRFRMLEVIRDVALHQLEVAGEMAQARDRHARWFLGFAEEAAGALTGGQQRAALDRLQTEEANLNTAVRHAVSTQDAEMALRLCLALRMLWYVRGSIAEGRALFAGALEVGGGPERVRAAAMIEAAALARHQGDLETAEALTGDAVREARHLGDERLLAAALLQRGFVLHLAGRWSDARPALEESLALSHRLDDRLAVARASHHLGIVAYFSDDDLPLAWELQCRALATFRDVQNQRHVCAVLITMTELARARSDLRAAHDLATEAVGHLTTLRDTPLLIHALHHVAALLAEEGKPTLAVRLIGAAEGLEAASGAAPWPSVASGARRWLPSAEQAIGRGRAQALRAQAGHLDVERALTLLGDAASDMPEPRTLTRREQEVAVLVAEGLTNRSIAERLTLSERTVDGHVARALTKLGLHNRTQLAAYVAGRA